MTVATVFDFHFNRLDWVPPVAGTIENPKLVVIQFGAAVAYDLPRKPLGRDSLGPLSLKVLLEGHLR